MESFNKENLVDAIRKTKTLMIENKQYLTDLDSVLGDGDLGLTMTKGFTDALDTAESFQGADIGKLFKQVGFTLAKSVPSTMGTLMASAFIGAGKKVDGSEALDSVSLAACFRSMAEAVSMRGKSKEGDKTLLDVLFPVSRAMEACESPNISVCLNKALSVAEESLEKTKEMINQHGKAAVYREKSLGHLDPGAVAAYFLVKGFAQAAQF
ncbi:MAG: dihydroxyacetone kinase subunit L [Clostridiaceae bacterium]|nr:dihydroxyacetone kinase subunit L [Clostridiaceae bacterium]